MTTTMVPRDPRALEDDLPDDLGRSTLTGTFWAAGDQLLKQVAQLAVYAVVARLLLPADFGLLAMAAVFTGFAALVGQLGLEASVVQARTLTQSALTGMFWLGLAVNTGIAVLLAGAATGIAALYDQPRLAAVVVGLSVAFPLNALAAVPRGLLMRRVDFRAVFTSDLVAITSGAAVTVAAALAGYGVASLVAGQVLQAGVTSAVLLARSPWRPRGWFRRADLQGHASYSGNLLAFNAVNYWARNADNLLIGRILGASALGYYERAYLLFLYPVSQITATLGRAMLSWLARVQDDLPEVRRIYLRAISIIAFVTAPLMLGLSAVSEPFVLTVFGSGWRPAIPVLAVLSACGAIQAVTSSVGFLYQSQGRTDLQFRLGLLNAVVIVVAIVVGVKLGSILAVAVTYGLVSTLVLFYPTVATPARLVGLQVRDVVRATAPSLGCGAGMALIVALVDRALLSETQPDVRLASDVLIGGLVYAGLVCGFRPAVARDVAAFAATRLRRPCRVSATGARPSPTGTDL